MPSKPGMGSHQKRVMDTDVWLTPPHIIEDLGPFDLDPCGSTNPPWPTAASAFTKADDGLSKLWMGRVWMNPPYGKKMPVWMSRLADHGDGIALIFARTGTKMFHEYVWERADAFLFLKGRVFFFKSRWH